MDLGFGVVILDKENAAYEDHYEPGAAPEIMAEPNKQAEGYQQDMPAKKPVG